MPEYRRLFVPGGTYFFTVNLHDRTSDLLTNHIDVLRGAYKYVCERHPFETAAIVILPDHLHCIWRLPPDDHDFPKRWRLLKERFTKGLPPGVAAEGRRKGERAVWQRRFWEHAIRDDADFERHVDYVHFNPVKHGHVTDPDDWPYSTWREYKREYGRPLSVDTPDGASRFA